MGRTDKNTRILFLYNALLNGHRVDKKLFSLEHGIDERTFDRDISDIRLFLSESFSVEKLIFDKESNTYQLSGSMPKHLDRMEVTVISKILLESGLLRKDEMHGLLNTIISTVTHKDAMVIEEYLSDDFKKYNSNTDVAILKFVEDLYVVIKSGYDIKIIVASEKGDLFHDVSPLKIICENNEFILIVADKFNLNNIIKIKIKNIVRFEKLQSSFAKVLKEKYLNTKEDFNGKDSKENIKNG